MNYKYFLLITMLAISSITYAQDNTTEFSNKIIYSAGATFKSTVDIENTLTAKELITEELIIQVDVFPDYVFDEDYNLLTLEEVEAFIAEHGRLPSFPSESEVVENGMNAEEILIKQMEKIEELTLYLIQLNKDIEELEEKVERIVAE
jgi:hypothetical protein